MDAVLLSRIQFALAAGFHFLFPPITLGLALIIVILETRYLRGGDELVKRMSAFLVKILALVFTVGVATGIVLEFSFGTNWSNYSRFVGDIFGAPLAAEGILSFFLESVFLGVLVFGRTRVSKRAYWLSAVLVCFASHLSGLWIIIANSWMQTPAGFRIENGRAVMTNFLEVVINHSSLVRYLHVVIASWITGSLFVAGIAAWNIVTARHEEVFRPLLKLSLAVFAAAVIIQLGSGHSHSVQVAKTQPEKMAAFEALWETTAGAPLSLFGIPVEKERKTYLEVSVPKLLSLLVHFDPNEKIAGLSEFPDNEKPPVLLTYASYHVMISLGFLFPAIAGVGFLLFVRKRLFDTPWYLWALVFAVPLPHVANLFGWMAAEVGRQPWVVYRVLRTADAASVVVPAGQVLFTLIMFGLIYALLFAVFLVILAKIIRTGPDGAAHEAH
ncbi:MAG TPA: cytochrome ubiquinol oxidase subunit I [Spirochaetota bacterium]|nr:cytochrome ubiquinol oxidase subunit I [Spirochaetota bacterium]HNT09872.1 cytochrome ubiquinol oxidase subunit I [Spirochaetota bacterium]HOS39944.1 cytochrome ubiquinol oxidase subunit I [Spirochaetota bacterium]